MKDAMGTELNVGDRIFYSTRFGLRGPARIVSITQRLDRRWESGKVVPYTKSWLTCKEGASYCVSVLKCESNILKVPSADSTTIS